MPSYLITGASRGIGLEYIRQLSADKNNIIFGLVRSKATAKGLIDLNLDNIHILEADITDHKALKSAALEVEKTIGSLDYLINNAAWVDDTRNGLTLSGYDDQDLLAKDLRDTFNINVIGVVFTINAFLPLLKKGTEKKVITISSGVGDLDTTLLAGYSAHAPYSISKAAVNMAVAKYAAEYKDEGFVFLSLSPGLVNTSTAPPTPEQLETYSAMIAAFRRLDPSFKGPLTPEESVKLQLNVISKVSIQDTGAFLSHHGNKQWL